METSAYSPPLDQNLEAVLTSQDVDFLGTVMFHSGRRGQFKPEHPPASSDSVSLPATLCITGGATCDVKIIEPCYTQNDKHFHVTI